ncbi:hypothetical protein D1013_08030 [Euzebyella marina]|uniref:TonB C-terminal domain-containing protein n=2 Tax=Euzebyella marina TaxID=1761453 RepID=A0A3G2L4W3_9FLAO|nr:hypothetical protein D1013_08030 [Euzebyella marina]
MYSRVLFVILYLITLSCSEDKKQEPYFNDLGEIPFDGQLDDKNFKVCHEDLTIPFNYGGFGLIYEGEKKKLVETIKEKFNYPQTKGQTGFITIRFIINCEGKTGRFRVIEMDLNLKVKKFDNNISNEILNITKGLDGWKSLERWEKAWDVQQYLTFKFEDGVITDILP